MTRVTLPFLAALTALLVSGTATAQVWIELVRVPERVSGRLDDGRNVIVTAEIHGGDAVDVWLARRRDDDRRAPLVRCGAARWQVNLAGERAAELLRHHREGEVAVHARTRSGRTASSVPIRFDVRGRSRETPPARIVGILGEIDGDRRRFDVEGGDVWMVPEDVDRLEVRLLWADPDDELAVVAGDRSWPLERESDRRAGLEVTPEIAGAWRRARTLTLRLGDDERVRLRAIPRELGPGERSRFTVGQREALELPGSHGRLEVSLGGITAGQVRTRVRTRGGGEVFFSLSRSLREGDRIRFSHRGERYVLELDCLVNLLIGHDHAEFEVWKPADAARGDDVGSRRDY